LRQITSFGVVSDRIFALICRMGYPLLTFRHTFNFYYNSDLTILYRSFLVWLFENFCPKKIILRKNLSLTNHVLLRVPCLLRMHNAYNFLPNPFFTILLFPKSCQVVCV
jgi:hypothetical protein